MINNSNIYKLIKKAKDDNLNTKDPLSKIIQNPIKFIYSFTLNSNNEEFIEEEKEEKKEIKISENPLKNKIKEKNIKHDIINNDNNINIYNNINIKKNIDEKKFLTKKKNPEKIEQKEKNTVQNIELNKKSNISKAVKNNIIHQIYNSKNINLWENESSDEDENKKSVNDKDILPIHKQIEFIDKCKNAFSKYDVAKKSEYDKELDKGRVKKIHKNKIGFKKHKNYFQKISNKQLKKQFKYNNTNKNININK